MGKQKNDGVTIRKASGEIEIFDVSKLKKSLRNAGASKEAANKIATDVEAWLYEGATTKRIYSRAYRLLRRQSVNNALRYKLKKALFELGPSGYPFEHYIAEIFKRQGYQTEVGRILQGRCITHELDVIATREKVQILMECKYSNDQGKHVGVQVPLYVRARLDDVIGIRSQLPEYKDFNFSGWIVSNTRFSPDALEYSKCNNLFLFGWDYPESRGLKDIIEKVKIFPVTILSHLTQKQKQILVQQGIITCTQLLSKTEVLNNFLLSSRKYQSLLKELNDIAG
jgi:hypothetical protein